MPSNPNLPPVTHLLLIRHGQTDANATGVVQGHLPTSLNAVGRAQSARIAEHLRQYDPSVTRLLTSPLRRAVETATYIAEHLRLPAVPDDRWVERHFGSQQGRPGSLHRIITHGGPPADPPDAEPRAEFDRRVAAALDALTTGPHEVIAVVTHGGVIGSVVRQLIGGTVPCDNPPAERVPVPNGAILHLAHHSGKWRVLRYFDTAHLHGLETALDAG